MAEQPRPPIVFISYSHDSKDHKIWVHDFAKKLRENGIDVMFDQWDLGYGDDIPKFMERAVRDADRVLMICTEKYVHKADEGIGGVGYEAMIVTGELVRDLGTAKFIPIVKQSPGGEPLLPRSVSTRKYVDLGNEANFEENFQELLAALHQVPLSPKPPLGSNPFAQRMSPSQTTSKDFSDLSTISPNFANVEELFKDALAIAREGDLVRWRKLVKDTRAYTSRALLEWRMAQETSQSPFVDSNDDRFKQGLSLYGSIISLALAGLVSGHSKFSNQFALLEDILFPKNWDRAGFVALADFPCVGTFIYQALHGAVSVHTGHLHVVPQFIRMHVDTPFGASLGQVWRIHDIMGFLNSLGRNSKHSWDILLSLFEDWPWLHNIFSDKDEYLTALTAYYMTLNINEYCYLLKEGGESGLEDVSRQCRMALDIPIHFLELDTDIERGAYRLLTEDLDQVKNLWRSLDISDARFVQYWDKWVALCKIWLGDDFTSWRLPIGHEKLGKEILPEK